MFKDVFDFGPNEVTLDALRRNELLAILPLIFHRGQVAQRGIWPLRIVVQLYELEYLLPGIDPRLVDYFGISATAFHAALPQRSACC